MEAEGEGSQWDERKVSGNDPGPSAKLAGEEILGRLVRRGIHRCVSARPGIHYSALKEELGLSDGVLNHHLRVLEKEGMVVSRKERYRRCFYPGGRKVSLRGLDGLTDLQAGVLYHVQLEQGLTQGALSERLGVSKQALNYHLRELCSRKLVYRRREGRFTRFYVDPARLAEELL